MNQKPDGIYTRPFNHFKHREVFDLKLQQFYFNCSWYYPQAQLGIYT